MRTRLIGLRGTRWGSILLSLSILLLVALLSSCAQPVTAGTVVDRRFSPAHDRRWPQQIPMGETCYGSGSSRYCTPNYITVWQTSHVPDRWFITLEACEIKDNQQECRRQEHRVEQTTYDDAQIGDYFAAQAVEPSSDVYTDR